MVFVGVDPGASGAICVMNDNGYAPISLCRLSNTEREVSDFLELFRAHADEVTALIERVHSMPRQGVASSFKFGQSYGFLRGLLTAHGVPFEEVTPQTWQKAMGCMSKGDKNVTKQKAGQLFPAVKVAHWNADALLIAEFCRRKFRMAELSKEILSS
jgi:crossover junction endodeoxyribonuclease RuvC